MRAFVAIPLSAEIRSRIKTFVQATGAADGVKAVPVENLHITLDFLGEISEAQKERLCSRLNAVAAKTTPFSLEIRGTGAFPKAADPKTLWLGVVRNEALFTLAAAVKTATNGKDTKAFSPHLTVGRVKYALQSQSRFFTEFFKYGEDSFGTLNVHSFFLMKSDLSGRTPVYSVIEEFIIKDGEIKDGKEYRE